MRISHAIGGAGILTWLLAYFTAAYMPLFHAANTRISHFNTLGFVFRSEQDKEGAD